MEIKHREMTLSAEGGPPWPAGAAWIDGRYCPVGEAKISVLDLGVTRSDCTYDVIIGSCADFVIVVTRGEGVRVCGGGRSRRGRTSGV